MRPARAAGLTRKGTLRALRAVRGRRLANRDCCTIKAYPPTEATYLIDRKRSAQPPLIIQPRALVGRVMTGEDRDRLVANITNHVKAGVTGELLPKVIHYWSSVSASLGARVAKEVNGGFGPGGRTASGSSPRVPPVARGHTGSQIGRARVIGDRYR